MITAALARNLLVAQSPSVLRNEWAGMRPTEPRSLVTGSSADPRQRLSCLPLNCKVRQARERFLYLVGGGLEDAGTSGPGLWQKCSQNTIRRLTSIATVRIDVCEQQWGPFVAWRTW